MQYLLLLSAVLAQATSDVIIETKLGWLKGEPSPRSPSVTRFLGVHYGSVAERFEKALPVSSWRGVLDATRYGNLCYQNTANTARLNEDCLTLDIYSTKNFTNSSDADLKAVMVFIHGGSFVTGNSKLYEGSILSDIGDVVVVVMQYRLGLFGFLHTGGLAPSNIGLWDQKLALEWIGEHIRSFGGDKSKVTIFGESAGAVAISCLMMSPYINTTHFQRAILQSGSILSGERMAPVQDKAFKVLLEATNCTEEEEDDYKAALDCLKVAEIEDILSGAEELRSYPFWPQSDGEFLPYGPDDILKKYDSEGEKGLKELLKGYMDYDTLMGANRQEGLALVKGLGLPGQIFEEGITKQAYSKIVQQYTLTPFNSNVNATDSLVEEIIANYDKMTPNKKELTIAQNRLLSLFDVIGDYHMTVPMVFQAIFHSILSPLKQSYFYIFDHKPEFKTFLDIDAKDDWFKFSANHGDELWLLFGIEKIVGISYSGKSLNKPDYQMSIDLIRYWTNFAKTGNPNRGEIFKSTRTREIWAQFQANQQNYLRITTQKDMWEVDPVDKKKDFLQCVWVSLYTASDNSTCKSTSQFAVRSGGNAPISEASLVFIFIVFYFL